jgi:N-methylhydantoinase B
MTTLERSDSRSTATLDGRPCHKELSAQNVVPVRWDGIVQPYIPTVEKVSSPGVEYHGEFERDIDPVTYQVLRWRLWNLNLEHGEALKRVCGTVVVCHVEDFNTSLLTECGDTVVGGPTLQRFVGMADLNVKWTIENRGVRPGIEDGDVFLNNDVYVGGTHQHDVAVFAPIFWEGKLFSWFFSAAHQMELGGDQPGSFCADAEDIFHEPNPWPPLKLVRAGEMADDVLAAFMRQSRLPAAVALNLRSQVAGIHAARKRMRDLLESHGPALVKGVMRKMIADTSSTLSRRLLSIPDGRWSEEYYLAIHRDRKVRKVRTTLRKDGDVLTFSNEGTGHQTGPGNGTYCGFRSAAVAAVGNMLAWDQLFCPAGILHHVRFDPVPSTLTIASHPAAVTVLYGTNMSISLGGQVVSKMVDAGAEEVRNRPMAAGGMSNGGFCNLWSVDDHGLERFAAIADDIVGGLGGSPGLDGLDTGGTWEMPTISAGNVEDVESASPVMYLYRREQPDSGGPGEWRGGNTVETALMSPSSGLWHFQPLSNDPGVNCTPGLAGGLPGHSGDWLGAESSALLEEFAAGRLPASRDGLLERLGGLERLAVYGQPLDLDASGVVVAEYCAGGGYGDPWDRDPAALERDLLEGSVSVTSAVEEYGAVLINERTVDRQATEARRAELRQRRLERSLLPPGDPAPSQAAVGTDVVQRVNGAVELRKLGSQWSWACSRCHHRLGAAAQNYRSGCGRIDQDPNALHIRRYPDPGRFFPVDLVFRQWLCPGCGRALATDIVCRDDPPVEDVRIDTASIEGRR